MRSQLEYDVKPYILGHLFVCPSCKKEMNPLGFQEKHSEGFKAQCAQCEHVWVLMTNEEQEREAEERMDDALDGFDPSKC